MEYILLLLFIAFLPLLISWLAIIVYRKCIDPESYDYTWAKTGAFLIGLRYTLKWITKIFFKGR